MILSIFLRVNPLNGFMIAQYSPNVSLVIGATHNILVSVLTFVLPFSNSSNLKFQTTFNQGEIELFAKSSKLEILAIFILAQKPIRLSYG